MQPDVDEHVKDVEWRTADAGAVRQFLLERYSVSPDLVEKALASIEKAMA